MKTMVYTKESIKIVAEATAKPNPSRHAKVLLNYMLAKKTFADLFNYGKQFLPRPNGGSPFPPDDYAPEIVEYFDLLSELEEMPMELRDLATDLSIYSDGQALQTDTYYSQTDWPAVIEITLAAYQNRV